MIQLMIQAADMRSQTLNKPRRQLIGIGSLTCGPNERRGTLYSGMAKAPQIHPCRSRSSRLDHRSWDCAFGSARSHAGPILSKIRKDDNGEDTPAGTPIRLPGSGRDADRVRLVEDKTATILHARALLFLAREAGYGAMRTAVGGQHWCMENRDE